MAQSPKVVRLSRLPVNWREQPGLLERYWDESMTAIEKALNDLLTVPLIQQALQDAQDAVAQAQAAAEAAQSAANGAGSDAATAQARADAEAKENSLVNSYVSSPTPTPSASSGGTVVVATHNRVYGNSILNPTVSVTGSTLETGAVPGSVVRVYYVDPTRTGGAVTFQYKIDPDPTPPQGKDIHSVGAVTIPTAGSTSGKYLRQPGFVEP